jgi:uncharacterized protein (DUF2236 family)
VTTEGRRITHLARLRGRDGYFAPESMIRRIAGSPVVNVLGIGPAILYQSAHPLVAAGIVAHSDYRHDLLQRWLSIFRASYLIVFGNRQEADAAAARVREVHSRVRGTTKEALGPFPAGTPYAADDPELLFWVNTSLIEVMLKLYGRQVRRLAIGEQERFYRDMTVLVRMLGASEAVIPPTFGDYREYVYERLAGPEVTVTAQARDIASVMLDGPHPVPFRPFAPANRLACAGLLPPRLREEYGLRWSSACDLGLAASSAAIRVAAFPLALAAERIPQSVVV